MNKRFCEFVIPLAILVANVNSGSVAQEQNNVPRNKDGIARKYQGDHGIENDQAVLFADSFETGSLKKWDEDQSNGDKSRCTVTSDSKLAFYGKHACQMTATRGKNNGGGLIKWFDKGQDELFARFYVKFAEDAGYTHHFVHINGSPSRWGSFGKAGLRPKGDDFFTTGIEPWFDWGKNPPPGKWMFYTYWPDMKGSPDGKYWGNGFHPESPVVARNQWICIEMRVKLNTPGKDDGEQSVWQNGILIGHFKGINWRKSDKLQANVFWLMNYVTDKAFKYTDQHAPKHKVTANNKSHTVWFDQVVVATQYIGPLSKKKNE